MQALGVIMASGVPVSCDEAGTCRALASSFCLERERGEPAHGTPYRLAAGQFTLVISHDGTVKRVPLGSDTRLTAARGAQSVELRFPRPLVDADTGNGLSLEIGPGVAVLPAADFGRRDHVEVTAAIQHRRAVGTRWVDDNGSPTDAVRLLNRALNVLPPRGGSLAGADETWTALTVGSPQSPGLRRAAASYEACRAKTGAGLFHVIRNCLILVHDRLIRDLTADYWRALAGS